MKPRRLTVSSIYSGNQRVPFIRLSGIWHAKLGFKSGRKAVITAKPGQIIISMLVLEDEGN